jgi:hypothetical protein
VKGDKIYYRRGYKYVFTRDYSCYTGIMLPHDVHGDFYTLTADGWCHLYKGFPWDGPSGLTFDTKNSMRGSAIHDAYCYATNDRLIEYDIVAPHHHDQLQTICIEDGMWEFRADRWHDAVIIGRGGHPDNGDDYPELSAP